MDLSLAAATVESPGITAANLHIDELNLDSAPQYSNMSVSRTEGIDITAANISRIEKAISIDSVSTLAVPSAPTNKEVHPDHVALNDGRGLDYPEPPDALGEGSEPRATYHSLMSDQLNLANINEHQQETSSPATSYEWDILRSSRMDWLGCETETSDAMTNALPGRPGDLHESQHLPAGITGSPTQSLTNLLPTGSLTGTGSTQGIAQASNRDQDTRDTWPHVLDRGGNDSWPFDYTSNKGSRKITLPPLQ